MSDSTPVSQDARIERLETQYGHLEEAISDIKRDQNEQFSALRSHMSTQYNSISASIEKLNDRGRITWPAIWTGLGTIISLALVAGMLHLQSQKPLYLGIDNVTESVASVRKDLKDHEKLDAHPSALKTLGMYEERFKTIQQKIDDAVINRKDMHQRLIDVTEDIKEDMQHLSTTMDRELDETVEDRLLPVIKELDNIRRQLNHSYNGVHND